MKIIFFLIFTIFTICLSFDAGKFEKCEQKSFCKRLRNQETTFYKNFRETKHLKMDAFGSTFELKDDTDPFREPLLSSVTAYDKGIFRIQIKEKTEGDQVLKHRNEVKDVLDKYALKVNVGQQESNLQGSLPEDYIFFFEEKPWRANLVKNNQKVLVFNAQSTLTVESQFRQKGEHVDPVTNETKKYGKKNLF